jgi:hydrogenase maturation protein HypF
MRNAGGGAAMKKPAIIQHSIQLPLQGHPVLATGSRFRNSLCVTNLDQAYLTRPLGDLDSASTCSSHEVTATELLVWQSTIPAAIVRDLDPDIHSSRFAIELAANLGIPHLAVQHHHAHVAAVCAEHALFDPAVGLVLDDGGMGNDGGNWGGELLHVDGASFERLGHLVPLVKPGGDIAERETWRMAAGALYHLQRTEEISKRFSDYPAAPDVTSMLIEGRNCPSTFSTGLQFATAANLLHMIPAADDHAALMTAFEEAAVRYFQGDYGTLRDNLWRIDMYNSLDLYPTLDRLADETNMQRGAASFHANLITGTAEWAAAACQTAGTPNVILAGACMSNRLLVTGLRNTLERRGLKVFAAKQIPADDSSVALGQAWIAQQSIRHGA